MINEINKDLDQTMKILDEKFGNSVQSEVFKSYFIKLFIFKYVFSFVKENEDVFSFSDIQKKGLLKTANCILDYIEFIWIVYYGRFKLSTTCVRNAIDLSARGLALLLELDEENSFSSNLNRSTKKIRENLETQIPNRLKKSNKKYLNEEFKEGYQNVYGEFSSVVHGKINIEENFNSFINHCVNSVDNRDTEQIKKEIKNAEKALEFSLEYFILINYDNLLNTFNNYLFDIFINFFSERFKQYKERYLTN